MSNLETAPVELHCQSQAATAAVEVLQARDVPLGGPRAMTVRRTLPQRARSLIGAWCFADHYGPSPGPMDVAPHPHTGLQTASWLFSGEVEHRDSTGAHAMVRPGELNLMTAGRGICHSEVSTAGTTVLHGVQLWIALPDAHRDVAPRFEHAAARSATLDGATVRVFLGRLAGERATIDTYSPLVGAELLVEPGAELTLDVDRGFEHGLLVDSGRVTLSGTDLGAPDLGYVGPGAARLTVTNRGPGPARMVLLGGEPLGEEIVMWWNFVGRNHEEIAEYRKQWQAESDRFGRVDGYVGAPQRLPAPTLPNIRLRPRGNPPSKG